jgi:hypothetical protein
VVEKVLDFKDDVELELTDDEGGGGADEEGQEEEGAGGAAAGKAKKEEGGAAGGEGGDGDGDGEEWVDSRVKACDAYVDGKPSGKGWFPMHRCRFVFNKIAEDEYAEWFYDPVDTSLYTDYLSIVQRPMCLAQIKAALESGAYHDNPYTFAEVRGLALPRVGRAP